ncbi:MAG: DUF3592 domain-containing protein [Tepidisphaeraceae bacterium]
MAQPPSKPDPSRRPPTIPYAGGSAPVRAVSVTAPPAPPPPPRPISSAVNRRSWTEPVVRSWLLATLALVAIGAWFFTQQLLAFRSEQRLIATGAIVTATVIEVNGEARVGAKYPPGLPCTLKFDWQGQTINAYGILSSNEYVTDGQSAVLRVDPNDPTVWTDRHRPEPLEQRIIAGAVVIPAALITLAAALMLRRRLLAIWRDAEAVLFSVVDTRHSALAPLSHTLRCVSATGRDPTIVTVYLPTRFPRPQTGEVLWLIHRTGKPKFAIVAIAYE